MTNGTATPRSHTPTSGFSVRMPQELRKRIRIAAGLDDALVADWVLNVLDRATRARLARGPMELLGMALEPRGDTLRRLEIREVTEVVADLFKLTPEALAARSKNDAILLPRQLAMYFCRRYTDAPVSEIAKAFHRDHPSVTNAEKVVREKVDQYPRFRRQFEDVAKRLGRLQAQDEGDTDEEAEAPRTR